MHKTLNLLAQIALATSMALMAQHASAQTEQLKAAPAPRSVPLNLFDPAVLNNLAVAKARRGELAEALTLLERAMRLTPKYPEVQQNHARLTEWIALTGSNSQPKAAAPVASSLHSMSTNPPPPALWPVPESR